MKTVRAVSELRSVLEPIRAAQRAIATGPGVVTGIDGAAPDSSGAAPASTIGLVPTMGALHEGHLSLIRRAREQCDFVVVSLFVNPAQFDERADLDRYPRQEEHDGALAAEAGADLLFAPPVDEVYPRGFSTFVEVAGLTDRLEGAVRGAEHFRGVTTVVAKLFNTVLPDVAYFGQKDAQQVAVIQRMATDLNIPVRIEVCPTVREPDGLAMSSRNARLSAREREQALALHRALTGAATLVREGVSDAQDLLRRARSEMETRGVQPEYVALVDPTDFEPLQRLSEPALLAIAARVGDTRLIDNVILEPSLTAGKASLADDARAEDPGSTDSIASPAVEPIPDYPNRTRSSSIALT
jgi:pantoate--beta-alanine ligase